MISLSMLGDIIGVSAQGGDRGLGDYAVGPLVGDLDVAQQATRDIIAGKPRAKYRLFRVAKQNVPGNNVWYLRLALDRMLADQVQRTIDPKYDQSFAAMQKRAAGQGQGFYWAPGEMLPQRAPNLANTVTGGKRQ